MNKKEKALINQALVSESSPSYWGRDNVHEYLKALKNLGFSDIKTTYDREVRKNRILDWVTNADPDLALFLAKNQEVERNRKQTAELLTLPVDVISKIKAQITGISEISYDAFRSGHWKNPEIVYMAKSDGIIEIWLAHKVGRVDSEKTAWSALSKEVQESLAANIQKNDVETVEIQSVYLEYNIFGRIINIITINLETSQASIKSDEKKYFDPDDSEEKRVNPEERFTDTLMSGLNSLGLKVEKETARELRENKRITKESVGKIHAIEEEAHLILPFKFEFLYEKGNTSERTRDEFFKITTLMLKPKVEAHYAARGTFQGFFEANRDLDVENNGILLKKLRDEENIEPIGNGFFIFIVDTEKRILYARVICHIATGSMRTIPESGQTKEDYARINKELDRLFP